MVILFLSVCTSRTVSIKKFMEGSIIVKEINLTPEQEQQINDMAQKGQLTEKARSPEFLAEIKARFAKEGVTLNNDQVYNIMDTMQDYITGKKELTKNELENIAGGTFLEGIGRNFGPITVGLAAIGTVAGLLTNPDNNLIGSALLGADTGILGSLTLTMGAAITNAIFTTE